MVSSTGFDIFPGKYLLFVQDSCKNQRKSNVYNDFPKIDTDFIKNIFQILKKHGMFHISPITRLFNGKQGSNIKALYLL